MVSNPAHDADSDALAVGAALGADSVEKVWTEVVAEPAALRQLAGRAAARLRSSGGRPTDPSWTLTRQVPFSSSTWDALQRLSEEVSGNGRRVGPGQVAAMLLEDRLSDLQAAIDRSSARRNAATDDG